MKHIFPVLSDNLLRSRRNKLKKKLENYALKKNLLLEKDCKVNMKFWFSKRQDRGQLIIVSVDKYFTQMKSIQILISSKIINIQGGNGTPGNRYRIELNRGLILGNVRLLSTIVNRSVGELMISFEKSIFQLNSLLFGLLTTDDKIIYYNTLSQIKTITPSLSLPSTILSLCLSPSPSILLSPSTSAWVPSSACVPPSLSLRGSWGGLFFACFFGCVLSYVLCLWGLCLLSYSSPLHSLYFAYCSLWPLYTTTPKMVVGCALVQAALWAALEREAGTPALLEAAAAAAAAAAVAAVWQQRKNSC